MYNIYLNILPLRVDDFLWLFRRHFDFRRLGFLNKEYRLQEGSGAMDRLEVSKVWTAKSEEDNREKLPDKLL